MNYKKYQEKVTHRYTIDIGKAPIWSNVFDTTFSNGNRGNYTNYSRKQWKLGLAYGLEKFISYRRVDFFYGIDAGLQFEQVLNGPNYSPSLGGGYADRPDDRETLDYVFGIVPFGGVRIRMFKGLFFNIELGAELNYISENRLYHTREEWETLTNEYFYFPALDKLFINNIGFSYRF